MARPWQALRGLVHRHSVRISYGTVACGTCGALIDVLDLADVWEKIDRG